MAPRRGRKRLWLSLHNSTPSTKLFTFDVEDSTVGGTIAIQGDELLNVFEAEPGDTYAISVAVENGTSDEYNWAVREDTESVVAELTDDGLRFKEMNVL